MAGKDVNLELCGCRAQVLGDIQTYFLTTLLVSFNSLTSDLLLIWANWTFLPRDFLKVLPGHTQSCIIL